MAAATSPLSPPEQRALDVQAIQNWYDMYISSSGQDQRSIDLIAEVDKDPLDNIQFEDQVQNLVPITAVADGYCKTCRHALANWPPKAASNEPWATTMTHLVAAIRAGCRLCAFFWSSTDPEQIDTFRKFERRLQLLGKAVSSYIILESRMLWITYPGKRWTSPIPVYGGRNLSYTDSLSHPLFSRNTELDRFESAVAWLTTCDESHDGCQRRTDLDRPRRLVSVRNEAIKVVDTESFGNMPYYATLSYCWGLDNFIKLTMETIDSFYEGVNYTGLPQTFQDAIFLTRRLGLDYIWIDALCIIQRQQDSSDWLSESAKMRSIYGGGYVNIAASQASNVHEGFLHRSGEYIGGITAKVSSSKGSHMQVFYARTVEDGEGWAYWEERSDLGQRGWAFQERLLAKRTLHFSKYGLLWECPESNAAEFAPEPQGPWGPGRLAYPDHEPWEWTEVVNGYSDTKLTVSSDKLTALAGIARRQYEAKPDQYLAGMWRRELIHQLCWRAVVHKDSRKRPDWRAPTWSWASIDRGVFGSWYPRGLLGNDTLNECVRLLDVWTTPSGPDPFGAVSNGELKLGCYALVRGRLSSQRPSSPSDVSAHETSKLHISLEASEQLFIVYLDCYGDIDTTKDTDVYLLPVWQSGTRPTSHSHVAPTNNPLTKGLVLQHIEGSQGRFRRLGAFFFTEENCWDETGVIEIVQIKTHVNEIDRDEHFGRMELGFARMELGRMRWRRTGKHSDFLRVIAQVGASTAARICDELSEGAVSADHRFIVTIE